MSYEDMRLFYEDMERREQQHIVKIQKLQRELNMLKVINNALIKVKDERGN